MASSLRLSPLAAGTDCSSSLKAVAPKALASCQLSHLTGCRSSWESKDYTRIALPPLRSRNSRRSATCVTVMYEEQCCDWRKAAASVLKISAATVSEQVRETRRAQV